jgi:hypothetical protein
MRINKTLLLTGILATASGLFAQSNNGSASIFTNSPSSASAAAPANAPSSEQPVIMSKKGEMYLPQAGDWAISMDATPFLNYFGDLIHGPSNNATTSFLSSNQTIVGKYYVDNHTAYRFLLRIGLNSNTQSEGTPSSDTGSAFPVPQVVDKRTVSSHYIGIGFGIEKRRGKTRLQGYYGIEGMVFLSGSDTSFTYGNAYNATSNPTPVWYDWYAPNTNSYYTGLPRPTDDAPGSTFGISVLAFIGVEYFIAPKISIGGEYTWGVSFQTTSQGSISIEEINPNTGLDQTDKYKTNGSSSFSLDNGWNQTFGAGTGSLYINFHF